MKLKQGLTFGGVGYNLLTAWETFKKSPYPDEGGGFDIAFGNQRYPDSLGGGAVGQHDNALSFDQNDSRAKDFVLDHMKNYVYQQIDSLIKIRLNQGQFDAICDFVYTTGRLYKRLANAINNPDLTQLQSVWLSFNTIRGKGVSDVITQRRQDEYKLFTTNTFTGKSKLQTDIHNAFFGGTAKAMMALPVTPVDQRPPVVEFVLLPMVGVGTLQDFITGWQINMTPNDLLNYAQYDNKTAIYKSYDATHKTQYTKANVNWVGMGALIAVPNSKRICQSVYSVNQNLILNRNTDAFIEAEIKKLLNNPGYKKISLNSANNNTATGTIYKHFQKATVWAFIRSIDNGGAHLVDISDLVESITLNTNENGGNFNISVPNILFKKKIAGQPVENVSDIFMRYFKQTAGDNFVHKSASHELTKIGKEKVQAYDDKTTFESNGQYFKRRESFFYHLMQNNDMIFIQTEKLEMDKLHRKSADFMINSATLFGQNFDMIGLLDSPTKSATSAGNTQSTTLAGRDLSKLLIDDGAFFFNVEYIAGNPETIIKNSTKTRASRRLMIPPSIINSSDYQSHIQDTVAGFAEDDTFNFTKTQSIEEWLIFIFSQLVNVEIVPDTLSKGYPNKTMTVSRETNVDKAGTYFYDLKNAVGIWQFVKLVVDEEIGKRRVADQSFSNAQGSLMNFIRKICQKPFCEFYMDTYADKYYFICRKPPFSQKAFASNYCLNIFEDDVYGDELSFNTNFFTYFHLTPSGSLIDDTGGAAMTLLPAVMLPEYMDMWGSKILDVTTQYLDFDMSNSTLTKVNNDDILKQGRQDLDWLLETHAYLPFTQQGTITIKADRRFKRGINVRYLPTGEVFYVDGVTQNRQYGDKANGSTTLHVSRGMVEKHLDKYFTVINLLRNAKSKPAQTPPAAPPAPLPPISTNGGATQPQSNTDNWDANTWTVNKDIFNFLLNRRQFIE